MKGLIWNCKSVNWIDLEGEKILTDCLLVYICCEKQDSRKEVKETVRRIQQLNRKRYFRDMIVIFPFAHLSGEIMIAQKAKPLIGDIAIELKKRTNVSIMGFNKNKEVKIHLLPSNIDVSFFNY